MSTSLLRVVERARREPEGRFHSLAHLIEVPALERAFHRLRADAAVGVDGVSKEDYGQELEANLVELHKRLKAKRYRHQPLRRVHIPKGGGRTRPIGISAVEDKVVQGALREVLEAVYEQDFLECSYGFRPGRSAHDAIRALNRAVYQGKVSWILEADIESFFDSLDRTRLEEMLRIRVADGSLRRLVWKVCPRWSAGRRGEDGARAGNPARVRTLAVVGEPVPASHTGRVVRARGEAAPWRRGGAGALLR